MGGLFPYYRGFQSERDQKEILAQIYGMKYSQTLSLLHHIQLNGIDL